MKYFCQYMHSRLSALLFLLLVILIFLAAFFLYGLPAAAVLYPSAVSLVLFFIYALLHFLRSKRKHQVLRSMEKLPPSLIQNMPQAESPLEKDYQKIIVSLSHQQQTLEADMTRRYQQMMDYYTIWAHQIKTPIASMRLTLQAEDSELSRQLSDDLQRIEQYVSMVLAFLRLDSDTHDFVFRRTDLDSVIREAARHLAPQFIRRKIALHYEPLHTYVITDEKWLSFVIEQVLSNAVKYTPAGSVTIAMEKDCVLTIRDTGIGIAPEDLPRVFERSFTGYNGRTDKKASGIGLWLCRRICTQLGHTISITSSQDSGTCVYIDLSQREIRE